MRRRLRTHPERVVARREVGRVAGERDVDRVRAAARGSRARACSRCPTAARSRRTGSRARTTGRCGSRRDAAQHRVGRDEVERAALVVRTPPAPVRHASRELVAVPASTARRARNASLRPWPLLPGRACRPRPIATNARSWRGRPSRWPRSGSGATPDSTARARVYAEIARAIARFEPVTMVAAPADAEGARARVRADGRRRRAARSTTRGSATPGPIVVVAADGAPARAALPVQRVGREVVAVGRRRRGRRARSPRTSACRCTRCRWCSKAARSRSTARARS